MDIEATILLKA